MRSKLFAVCLGLLTVLLLVMTGAKTARADTIESTGLSGNEAVVKDRYGNVITDPSKLSKWESYDISYQWAIEDGTPIASGDTTPVKLPTGAVAIRDLSFPIRDSNGMVIGTFIIKAGETSGEILFNDKFASTGTNRTGTLNFYVRGTAIDENINFDWSLNKIGWIGDRDADGRPSKVTWNVAFNPTSSNLGRVVVTDQLGANQTFLPDSVNAEAGSYNTAGMFVGNGTMLQPTVSVDGNEITFVFAHVATAVNMTYQVSLTHVNNIGGGAWSNQVTLNGVTIGSRVVWGGSGTGSGNGNGTGSGDDDPLGSVILRKTAADTQAPLTGAEYTLEDADGVVISPNIPTTDGKIFVTDLMPGNYRFVEVKAPDGYELNSQPIPFTIAAGTASTPVQVSQSDQPLKGAVTLTKHAENSATTLAGAVYDLQTATGKVLQSGLTTDVAGQLTVRDLTPGDYQLVETKAPTGYELAATPVTFTIAANATSTPITVSQNDTPIPITGRVILTKQTPLASPLAGAEYELQASSGLVLKTGLTTDTAGHLSVDDLAPGDYQLVETKAPTGYELNPQPVRFTITAKVNQPPVTLTQVDDPVTPSVGQVTLTKIDATTQKPLAGALYELRTVKGQVVQTGLTTNVAGQVVVKDLAAGNYQLFEIQAPVGYALNQRPLTIVIPDTGAPVHVAVTQSDQPLPVPPALGAVTLTKLAMASKHPLTGAVYTLQTATGQVVQANLTTAANGELTVPDLQPGHYQFVETKAPTGYGLNKQPLPFTITLGVTTPVMVTAYDVKQPVPPIKPPVQPPIEPPVVTEPPVKPTPVPPVSPGEPPVVTPSLPQPPVGETPLVPQPTVPGLPPVSGGNPTDSPEPVAPAPLPKPMAPFEPSQPGPIPQLPESSLPAGTLTPGPTTSTGGLPATNERRSLLTILGWLSGLILLAWFGWRQWRRR